MKNDSNRLCALVYFWFCNGLGAGYKAPHESMVSLPVALGRGDGWRKIMAVSITAPERDNNLVRTKSGIILPPSYAGSSYAAPVRAEPGSVIANMQSQMGIRFNQGFGSGFSLNRDEETMIVCWPAKYSGLDDITMGEIVDGNIANAGIAPVVSSLLSSAVMKQVAQVANADITLTGKASPVKKARDGIQRWNDSPTGALYGLTKMAYQLLVYNRGAPLATVPLTLPVEKWEEYGLILHPMPKPGETESESSSLWLEVDWSKMGSPIPFLPSPFDLEPTNSQEWPYWYRVRIGKKDRWVLLHHSQIIPVLPGASQRPGFGTSSAWLSTEQLSLYILAQDGKAEGIVNAPTTGFVAISGIDQTPQAVKDKILSDRKQAIAQGNFFDKSPTILVSREKVSFDSFSFRDMKEWTETDIARFEDRVATNFRMSLSDLGVSRGGVGYAAQAQVTRDAAADSGAGYLLSVIASALGAIYPRVSISINRPNDYARVRQLEDLSTFTAAVGNLPDGTLAKEEIRAMIESLVGVKIPTVGDVVTTSPGSDDDGEIASNDGEQSQAESELSASIEAMLWDAYQISQLENVEDTLDGPKGDNLFARWFDGLKKQYNSAKVKKIVEEINRKEISTDDPEFIAKVAPITKKHTKKLSSTLNRTATLTALLAIAKAGRLEAEEQGADNDKRITQPERNSIDNSAQDDLNQRLDQLLIKATGNSDADRLDLTDQKAKQILDVHSYEVITALIWSLMLDDIEIPVIIERYRLAVPGSVEPRAQLLTDVEGSRAYNIGFSKTGKKIGAVKKRWNMTRSDAPRESHLSIVGEIVGINQRFSTGDDWAGEVYGCKCSNTLIFR